MNLKLIPTYDFVTALVTGEFSLEESNEIFVRILQYTQENHVVKVLVDCSKLEGLGKLVEQYQHARFGTDHYISQLISGNIQPVKLAYLMPPEHLEISNLTTMVAKNRGVWVQDFSDKQIAINWLMEQ